MLRKKRREGPGEINAGSMADIAFLLLIFFLVTTTMDTDAGILRLLPPIVDDMENIDKVKDRNVYIVLINDADQLLVEGEPMDIKDLRAGAKEFMTNPTNAENLPEKTRITAAVCREQIAFNRSYLAGATEDEDRVRFQKEIDRWEDKLLAVELLGEFMELPNSAVISLQTGSKTSYNMYVQVQNELEAGIRELREDLSREKLGRRFSELNDKDEDDQKLIKAIRMVYPQRISEAEPVDVSRRNQ
ncbi:MAG: biopolymer transporter ExbD [Flavobacteriales bacterium]|nr:biopolymer transporter ExbD [Flavobacteriales bacterium]